MSGMGTLPRGFGGYSAGAGDESPRPPGRLATLIGELSQISSRIGSNVSEQERKLDRTFGPAPVGGAGDLQKRSSEESLLDQLSCEIEALKSLAERLAHCTGRLQDNL
ncbi:hypothetical protein EOD42_14295 [Rhodovarius crocodyli]|uniref:Uncharacterized protein n=1 Tax=Rhodovarius crocodyli TaxID=1979269 RepID=A0A437MF80_9PROT|nr:hypothetical protein [Rhodovarius crocodyli]RVT96279.1 hypothetical protein EOD42_14295 [Rhodovarius crocodyli]